MTYSTEVRLPKLVVRFNLLRQDDIEVVATVYRNGLGVDYSTRATYSAVGNMARSANLNPTRRRIDVLLANCKDRFGVGLPSEAYEGKISQIQEAIVNEEGEVWKYFDSFNTAVYDEVTDSWSRV